MAEQGRKHVYTAVLIAASMLWLGILAAPAFASASTTKSTCGTTSAISLDPTSGEAGTVVAVAGTGFCAGTTFTIRFVDAAGTTFPLQGPTAVNPDGTFSASVAIPNAAETGTGTMKVRDKDSKQCAPASFDVTEPG